MKKTDTLFSIALCWFLFIIWEIMLHQWLKNEEMAVFRIDLFIILPGLIGITIYYFHKIQKENIEE